MTEIPEHLLKRSRERRAAIGQGGDDAAPAADAPAASATPATTAAASAPAATSSAPASRTAAPAPAAPPPPKPDPVYVQAAKTRKKIPFWAMATLSLMPVWAFMYVRALTESPDVAHGPLGVGAEVYGNCSSCHGAQGNDSNTVGYPFADGAVLATFPRITDQLRYVYYGTEGFNLAGIEIYGNPDRPGGPHIAGGRGVMPAFGPQLTQAEIIGVVCHERYTLGGADPTSEEYAEEYEAWCSEEAPIFAAVESGAFDLTSTDTNPVEGVEIDPVGPAPIEGSAG